MNENISHTTIYNRLLFWTAWGERMRFVDALTASVERNQPCLVCAVRRNMSNAFFKGSIL